MLRNVGRLDSLTRSIDGAPSDADLALEFNNPYLRPMRGVPSWRPKFPSSQRHKNYSAGAGPAARRQPAEYRRGAVFSREIYMFILIKMNILLNIIIYIFLFGVILYVSVTSLAREDYLESRHHDLGQPTVGNTDSAC